MAGFGDLSKLSKEQFVEIVNRKALGLYGKSSQKVVPAEELEKWIEQGWDYKRDLPNGKVVIGLRTG